MASKTQSRNINVTNAISNNSSPMNKTNSSIDSIPIFDCKYQEWYGFDSSFHKSKFNTPNLNKQGSNYIIPDNNKNK